MKKRFSYFRWFLFLFFLLSVPFLPIGNYQLHIIIIGCIYAVMVLSLNLITGYVGELSLGNVAFFGVGAFTSALLTLGGVSFWVSFLAAGMVAGIFGSLIGYITLKLRGAYFVIVTLAFAEILRLIDTNWTSLTNGPMGLSNIPLPEIHIPYLLNITFSDKIHFYYLSLGLLLLALYVVYRLVNSRIGRAWVSIRENEDLAKSIGINAFNYALLAFVVGAIFTGLGGSVYAHYMSFIGPDVFSFSITVSMLIMLIMGGKGTIIGPIIGAFVFTALPEYLRIAQLYRLSILGIILIFAVIFLPAGIVSMPKRIISFIKERRRQFGTS